MNRPSRFMCLIFLLLLLLLHDETTDICLSVQSEMRFLPSPRRRSSEQSLEDYIDPCKRLLCNQVQRVSAGLALLPFAYSILVQHHRDIIIVTCRLRLLDICCVVCHTVLSLLTSQLASSYNLLLLSTLLPYTLSCSLASTIVVETSLTRAKPASDLASVVLHPRRGERKTRSFMSQQQ
jgi:hypothetical protein